MTAIAASMSFQKSGERAPAPRRRGPGARSSMATGASAPKKPSGSVGADAVS